jgi:hypothetical protein
MSSNAIRRVFAALLCLLPGAGLSGQSYEAFRMEWARVTERSPLRLGPLRAFPAFEIRRLGYGDNVYFEDRPARDFMATLAPSLTLYLPLRNRAILYVRESPEYTFYLKDSRVREFTNGYGGGAKVLLFNRFVLQGDHQFQSRVQAISVEIGRPVRETRTLTSAGLYYETARRTSVGLTGSIEKISFKDVSAAEGLALLSSVLDRTERNAALEMYYRIRSDAYVFLTAGTTDYRFDQAAAGRDATSVQALAGMRFPLLGRLTGIVSLGYKKFDPKAPGRASYSGPVADSRIEARTGRFAVRAGIRRDLRFSYFENAFFYLEDGLYAGGSYYPVGFARLDYSYYQGYLRYRGIGTAAPSFGGAVTDPRTDRLWTHSAALVFRVFRTAGLGIQLSTERWTSTVPGWDRDRSFVGAVLTTRF